MRAATIVAVLVAMGCSDAGMAASASRGEDSPARGEPLHELTLRAETTIGDRYQEVEIVCDGQRWSGVARRRGSTSRGYAKPSYRLEIRDRDGRDLDVALCGLTADADWILHAPARDHSGMRNALAYQLSRDLGRWAPQTRYVSLQVNDRRRGLYVLTERIEAGDHRVAVGADGVMFRSDKIDRGDIVHRTPSGVSLIQDVPRQGVAEAAAVADALDRALNGDDWEQAIDIDSFVDFAIIQELALNCDAYQSSTYYHKRASGPVVAGPVWDFDHAFGPRFGCVGPAGWLTRGVLDRRAPWWRTLFSKARFVDRFIERWRNARHSELSDERLRARVSEHARVQATIEAQPARRRRAKRKLERWLLARAAWIDDHIEELQVP